MGCFGSRFFDVLRSKLGFRDRPLQRNVFSVLNIDELGRHVSPGKIEVTETDLILHLRGKPPLTWPLRCLRRYGFEEELFSFESGRRCPIGPGIYAFKCSQAQSLFNILQSKIHSTLGTTNPSTPISPTTTNPASVNPTFDYVNINDNRTVGGQDSENCLNTYLQSTRGSSVEGDQPLYMNVESSIFQQKPTSNSYIPQNQSSRNFMDKKNNAININFDTHHPSSSSIYYTNVNCSHPCSFDGGLPESVEVNYAELDLEKPEIQRQQQTSTSSTIPGIVQLDEDIDDEIDKKVQKSNGHSSSSGILNGSRSNTSAKLNDSPSECSRINKANNGELGYATIDFVKTQQLNVVKRSKIKLDFNEIPPSSPSETGPPKKTRHNSTAL